MTNNVLVLGAAGYIGGSIGQALSSTRIPALKTLKVVAAVRGDDQVKALSEKGINAIKLDIKDKVAVQEAILGHDIDIVIQAANSFDMEIAPYPIEALGERKRRSGKQTYYIHASVTALYDVTAGWPFGEIKDSDQVFEREKEWDAPHPVRMTDIVVAEQAEAHGVTSFNISIPTVYGRGTGEWRKLSVNIPAFIRAAIKRKRVDRFDKDGSHPATHISDLVAFYMLLVEKIVAKDVIPSGRDGYYFATAHRLSLWETLDRIALDLHARGMTDDAIVHDWPSYDAGADALGFPRQFIKPMVTNSATIVADNPFKLGWKPGFDERRFLQSIHEEVQDVLEFDTVAFTLFDSLLKDQK